MKDQCNGVVNGSPFHLTLGGKEPSRPKKLTPKQILAQQIVLEENRRYIATEWNDCASCGDKCPPNETTCIVCFAKSLKQ